MSPINTVGKNSQQILSLIQKQLKTYHILLNECTKSGRVEAALINHVQVSYLVSTVSARCMSWSISVPSGPDVLCSVPKLVGIMCDSCLP